MRSPPPARYAPREPFPPYAFIAGHRPRHPERPEAPPTPLDPERWRASERYLFGVDLFNHGFYWEAHEAWEALWHAAGRRGPAAEFLKGLIKLAAAGVKVRQAQPRGVRIHGERAEADFRSVRDVTGAGRYAGLDLDEMIGFAREVAARADSLRGDPAKEVEIVFDQRLLPQ